MIPTNSPHDDLLESARRGDAAARDAMLASQRDRLRCLISSRLDHRIASRVDPSDVVQEVLADAATGLPKYLNDPPLPFFPWLCQFVRERLAKQHRFHIGAGKRSVSREQRDGVGNRGASDGDPARHLAASGTSPSGRVIRDESRQRVWDAMTRLSASDRRVLTMRYVDAYTGAEMAEILGASEGAVKVRHLRALRRLRTLLEGSP